MVSKEEKQKALGAWAEAVQEGANEFLELALEMKEAGKAGYEWPYMFGLFVDQLAKHIRTGSCAPDMTKAQKTHLAVALDAVEKGYTEYRNAVDVPLFDRAEKMFMALQAFMGLCPVQLPVIKQAKKEAKKEQLELPVEHDVVIVLPKGTPEERVKRITDKATELMASEGDGLLLHVSVGNDESTQVRVRAGNEGKYSAVIDEVLRGHIPVPEKSPAPTE
jgi:hypothetical protein